METNRNFYKDRETGEVFVIETSWQGDIIASCGPIEGTLQSPGTYELTTEKNAELETVNDKLMLVGPQS